MADVPDNRAWYQKRRWSVWFAGVGRSIIHGIATAGSFVLGIGAANAVGIAMPTLTLRQFGVALLVGAGKELFTFWSGKPWAAEEDDTAHLTAPPP